MLDASALLRLYLADGPLPERLEAVMERGCRGEEVLLVPDLCWLEITSVLSRQISRALLSAEEAVELLAELQRLPLRTMASKHGSLRLRAPAQPSAADQRVCRHLSGFGPPLRGHPAHR